MAAMRQDFVPQVMAAAEIISRAALSITRP
jgi:hypothetical protein